jgi:hypothetical protein
VDTCLAARKEASRAEFFAALPFDPSSAFIGEAETDGERLLLFRSRFKFLNCSTRSLGLVVRVGAASCPHSCVGSECSWLLSSESCFLSAASPSTISFVRIAARFLGFPCCPSIFSARSCFFDLTAPCTCIDDGCV